MRNIYRYATKTPLKPSGKIKEKIIWHIRPSLKTNFLRILRAMHIFNMSCIPS